MPTISIIITVYNKATCLAHCLESCLRQQEVPADCYEVIAVNDGSTDGSLSFLQEYAAKDTRLRIIDQPNAGLSMARNNGAEAARGAYLWFVDGDDWIAPDAVKTLLAQLAVQPDVVAFRARTEGETEERNPLPAGLHSGRELLRGNLFEDCAPFYLYRADFLRDWRLRFYPGICHEDAEFTPRVLFVAPVVSVCDKVLYHVFPDPGSIARQPSVKRAYDLVTVAESLAGFRLQHAMGPGTMAAFSFRISKALNNALSIIVMFDSNEQKAFDSHLYSHRKLFKEMGGSLKYSLERVLFRIFPRNCLTVYRCMKGGRV
ncbi:MAG: glycosyltransferase [Bacteroidales bacterium]|nr:glycosyltransferase [Bacteroidales bacterium]